MNDTPPEDDAFTPVLEGLIDRILLLADRMMPDRLLYGYQKEFARAIIRSVLTGAADEITALFARQSGKTETVARTVAALVLIVPLLAGRSQKSEVNSTLTGLSARLEGLDGFQSGLWVGLFAPVKEQASTSFERFQDIILSEFGQLILEELDITVTENNKSVLGLSNGSCVRIASTMPTSNIESRTLHLAVVEEAQDVDSIKISKSIEPMLASTAGTLVLVGTANTVKSFFWQAIEKNRRHDRDQLDAHQSQINHGAAAINPIKKLHFEYDWTVVVGYNRRYRRYLNAKVLSHGEEWVNSDSFKMAYGCQFMLERGQLMTVNRLMEFEALGRDIPRGPYGPDGLCPLRAPMVAGIDWGKSGDSTVVTVIAKYGDCLRIVDWLELNGDDYDSQFEAIVAFLQRFPSLQRVISETNGVGDPMTDRLRKAARLQHLNAVINGYLATEANNSDGYKNLLMDFVQGSRLLFPADAPARKSQEYQQFTHQLTTVVKQWRGSFLKVHAPDDRHHDDYVSSLMMAYWAATRLGSPDIFQGFYGKHY